MRLGRETVIGVAGAGAMGAGIAQVAAVQGHEVIIADPMPAAIDRARARIERALAKEVEQKHLTRAEADGALARVTSIPGGGDVQLAAFERCGLVIEAIIEDLPAKKALFTSFERVTRPDAVLATNTSSLSVAAIGAACEHSGRVIGIHFFNPAPVMPLVEIVPAITTDPSVTQAVRTLVDGWGKTTVFASDTPGFIVNRIARPFYGESLRLLEEGAADCATIDWAMRTVGGFRMGPFELMDFIGNDINYAVTASVFEAMYYDPRYRPALTQRRLVEAGLLGRKAKRGYYDYRDGAERPAPREDRALGQRMVDRVLAMLVNEAVEALNLRVSNAADIDLAMTKGMNYPKGPLAWGDEIGAATILARLEALQAEYGEDRYRPSPLLRRLAASGGRLLA
jgi:3-hydroxybutyryl-CoA dehydrogenase